MGITYNEGLGVSGGTPPYVWSVTTGALPAGLNLDTAGVISGTPTAVETPTFTVTVTAAQVLYPGHQGEYSPGHHFLNPGESVDVLVQ